MTNEEKRLRLQELSNFIMFLNLKILKAGLELDGFPEDNGDYIVATAELILKKVYELYPDTFKIYKSVCKDIFK